MVEISGGSRVIDKLMKMEASVKSAAVVTVGFQDGSTGADGQLLALRAALNEYGVPSHNQPPRPFFRRMIAKNKSKWPKNLATALVATNYDAARSLGLIGQEIEGELRQSINDLVSPKLAESTVQRKGFDKPLIEHAEMIDSITSEVK